MRRRREEKGKRRGRESEEDQLDGKQTSESRFCHYDLVVEEADEKNSERQRKNERGARWWCKFLHWNEC